MTNLVILSPDIPLSSTRIRSRQPFNGLYPADNLFAKDRRTKALINATYQWGFYYEFDLGKNVAGTTQTKPSDFLYIARADLLKGIGGVTQVRLQGSSVSMFTPSDISGLVNWYDGNVGWDTSPIGSWVDQSPNVYTVTQGTAGNKPTLTASSYNGHTTVDFDGTDDQLSVASGTLAQPNTVFIVVNPDRITGTNCIFDSTATAISAVRIFNSNYELHSGTQMFGGAATVGQTDIVIGEFNGASSKIFINSGSTAAATGNAGTNSRYTGFKMGRDFTNGAPFDGKIGEVISYNKILSSTERQNVYDYLYAKWKTTPEYTNSSWNSSTLIGPNSEDWVTTFTQSTAYRYWWVFLRSAANEYYRHSKLWCGRQLDMGRDVEDYTPMIIHDDKTAWKSNSGTLNSVRAKRPRYRYDLSWLGVTDSKVQDFVNYIAKNAHRSSCALYATGNTPVLSDKTVIHCKLTDWKATKLYSGSTLNDVQATFEELPS